MTIHTWIAVAGAAATFFTIVECLSGKVRWRRCTTSFVAFACLVALAVIPCQPLFTKSHNPPPMPTVESRPDIDHTEKLMIAHYRRIRTEREIANAWTK